MNSTLGYYINNIDKLRNGDKYLLYKYYTAETQ